MNKWIWILCFLCVVPFLFLGCSKKDADGKMTIRIASVLPEGHPSSRALYFFKQKLQDESGGKFDVQLFFNSQLGSETEAIEFCQANTIEMMFVSVAPLSQYAPELNALSMPFIFRDSDHMHHVLDGAVGDIFKSKLTSLNLRVLCYFDAGSRNIMTKKGLIHSPEDLQGMKIRVMGSPLMIDTVNALGASAIPMSQGEVYTALQTGVLDGWENNPPTTLSFKMYETGCIYYARTEHLMVPDLLVINKTFYDGLSPELKTVLDHVSMETRDQQRQFWREDEVATIEKLKEAGMEFNDVDKSLFQSRVVPVHEKYYTKYGEEFKLICEQIKSEQ